METQNNKANAFQHKRQPQDTNFQAQMQRVFAALYRQPKTMLMASIETGILRANICRYVAEWGEREPYSYSTERHLPNFKTPCRVLHHQPRFIPYC